MLDFGHNYIFEGPEKWTSILPEPQNCLTGSYLHSYFQFLVYQISITIVGFETLTLHDHEVVSNNEIHPE